MKCCARCNPDDTLEIIHLLQIMIPWAFVKIHQLILGLTSECVTNIYETGISKIMDNSNAYFGFKWVEARDLQA